MPIEQKAPEVERIVALNVEIEWLGSGFGGVDDRGKLKGVAEGPVWWKAGGWWKEGGFLLFSDVATSKRYKWAPGEGITVDKEPTNDANGLTRDRQGRLVVCEHASRRVTREELDGSLTVVANHYRGQRLNRPNDVVVKSDGAIYFTDPITLGVQTELDFAGVYRVAPDLGTINLLVRDFVLPNGLAFSPDEKLLYINDSVRRHIRAFQVDPVWDSGLLNLGSDRVFCDMSGDKRPGAPDGMKVDTEGNVYCTGPGGIWIMDRTGKPLGIVLTGDKHVTNLCFGGEDWRTLFLTTFNEVGRLPVKIPGIPVPRGVL
jgi:gluconolactonase